MMATTKAAPAKQMQQPTFATCDMERHWLSPYHLECDVEMPAVKAAVAAFERWEDIQTDAAEAPARQSYGEHVARHLAGVFPGARVNVEAYSAAAGEDLAGFSADIVKLVAQRARRTLKTLPAIAQLVEMAASEDAQRRKQWKAYRSALRAHAQAVEAGEREADRIAECAAASGLPYPLDAAAILRFDYLLTDLPLGIDEAGPTTQWRRRVSRALLQRIARGDADACARAAEFLEADRDQLARSDATQDPAEQNAIYDAWYERHRAAKAALGEYLGLPVPRDVML